MEIKLRSIQVSDLPIYQDWKLPHHPYHQLNGPYFKKESPTEVQELIQQLEKKIKNGIQNPLPQRKLIVNSANHIIGEVSWYWRSEETHWMEIGIVIFDEHYWGKGIGFHALQEWINELFQEYPFLVRLGLTTWSGNEGMIRLAQKLGFQEEARYRKARIVDGKYYDSVSYGILKEEWESRNVV